MKALRRLAEKDIITRDVTVKIQQVAVRGNYENPSNDAKVKMSRADCKNNTKIHVVEII
jgi:hypothetical protein